ncbi:hypothetical protein [Lyngbya confervoides]|uniref:Bacterial Pleckstrin homology domain-containing protein n=1 Tax=Lyngbya confervoides BDU141951 TaxID=1574623 RepID=A0ABD4T861_9CYAN|nr:hypothetical protein [Lyngbya confervoides]MCM1984658.1 hypothetical protein [Lyngbya confervoides BDU141951]
MADSSTTFTCASTCFRISPLIATALWSFYLTLTFPLPLLAFQQQQVVSGWLAIGGIALGAIALLGALSEQVHLDDQGIEVRYPRWVPRGFRASWRLAWEDIVEVRSRSTGQGGLVYYLLKSTGQAYLLPMRVAGFAAMTRRIQAETGVDLALSKPLAQVWMYGLLLGASVLLGLSDAWVVSMLLQGQ